MRAGVVVPENRLTPRRAEISARALAISSRGRSTLRASRINEHVALARVAVKRVPQGVLPPPQLLWLRTRVYTASPRELPPEEKAYQPNITGSPEEL
jgi:hypothetical protein